MPRQFAFWQFMHVYNLFVYMKFFRTSVIGNVITLLSKGGLQSSCISREQGAFLDFVNELLVDASPTAVAPDEAPAACGAAAVPHVIDVLRLAGSAYRIVSALVSSAHSRLQKAGPEAGDAKVVEAMLLVGEVLQLAADVAAAAQRSGVALEDSQPLVSEVAGIATLLPAAVHAASKGAAAAAGTAASIPASRVALVVETWKERLYSSCIRPFAVLVRRLPLQGPSMLHSLVQSILSDKDTLQAVSQLAAGLRDDLRRFDLSMDPENAYSRVAPAVPAKLVGEGAVLQAEAIRAAATFNPAAIMCAVGVITLEEEMSVASHKQLLSHALAGFPSAEADSSDHSPVLALLLAAAVSITKSEGNAPSPSAKTTKTSAAAAKPKAIAAPKLPPRNAAPREPPPVSEFTESGIFGHLFREPSLSSLLTEADGSDSARAGGQQQQPCNSDWRQLCYTLSSMLLATEQPSDADVDVAVALLGFMPQPLPGLQPALLSASKRSTAVAQRIVSRLLLASLPPHHLGHANADRVMQIATAASLHLAQQASTGVAPLEDFVLSMWTDFAHNTQSLLAEPLEEAQLKKLAWLISPQRLAPLLLLSCAAAPSTKAAASVLLLRYLQLSMQAHIATPADQIVDLGFPMLAAAMSILQTVLLLTQPAAQSAPALAAHFQASLTRQAASGSAGPATSEQQWIDFMLGCTPPAPPQPDAGAAPKPSGSATKPLVQIVSASSSSSAGTAAAEAPVPAFPLLLQPAVHFSSDGCAAAIAETMGDAASQLARQWLQRSPVLSPLLGGVERGAPTQQQGLAGPLSAVVDRLVPSLASSMADQTERAVTPSLLACLTFCTQLGTALFCRYLPLSDASSAGRMPAAFNSFGSTVHMAQLVRRASDLKLLAPRGSLLAFPEASPAASPVSSPSGAEKAPVGTQAALPAGAEGGTSPVDSNLDRGGALLLEGLEGAALRLQLADLQGPISPMLRHQFAGTSAELCALLHLASSVIPALDAPNTQRFVGLVAKLLLQYSTIYRYEYHHNFECTPNNQARWNSCNSCLRSASLGRFPIFSLLPRLPLLTVPT